MADELLCEVCHKPIEAGQDFVHHQRLNVNIHSTCPRDNVKGEDISGHTLTFMRRAS